jgi:hypothetical protein
MAGVPILAARIAQPRDQFHPLSAILRSISERG